MYSRNKRKRVIGDYRKRDARNDIIRLSINILREIAQKAFLIEIKRRRLQYALSYNKWRQ